MHLLRLSVLLLALVAAVLLWLLANPAHLQPLIPHARLLLPADTQIDQIEGLEIGVLGGEFRELKLNWQGNRVHVDTASWRWDLVRVWPPELGLDAFSAGTVTVHLAPIETTSPARWRAIPLLSETTLWPLLAELHLVVDQILLSNSAGELLLDGQFEMAPALRRGSGRIRQADGSKFEFDWRESAPQTGFDWQLDWRSNVFADTEGTLQFSHHQRRLDWQLLAQAPQLNVADQPLQRTRMAMQGVAMPFEQSPVLLRADFELATTLENLRDTPVIVNCHGRLATQVDYSTEVLSEGCTVSDSTLNVSIAMPLRAQISSEMAVGSVAIEAGTLTVDPFTIDAWQLSDFRLNVEPAVLWQEASDTCLPDSIRAASNEENCSFGAVLPDLNYQISFSNTALSLNSSATGVVSDIRFADLSEWRLELTGEFQTVFQEHTLLPWQLALSFTGTTQDFTARGTIDNAEFGILASIEANGSRAPFAYQVQAQLDSDAWHWQGDLLQQLLGSGQTLLPAQLTAADVTAQLIWSATSKSSSATLNGQIEKLYGVSNGVAIAGLSVAPFSVPIRDGVIQGKTRIDWRAQGLNGGFAATDLSGSAYWFDDTWQLRNIRGELFGGEFTIPVLNDFSHDGQQGVLSFRGFDLETIIGMLDTPDLTVTGHIDGRVPLVWQQNTLVVPDGTMNSQHAGVIRYRSQGDAEPVSTGNPQLDLTRRALANMQYETLEAELAYSKSGDLTIDAKLRGSNPELENGRPIHLNLHVENNILSLLQSLRASEQINAWLERQLDR